MEKGQNHKATNSGRGLKMKECKTENYKQGNVCSYYSLVEIDLLGVKKKEITVELLGVQLLQFIHS